MNIHPRHVVLLNEKVLQSMVRVVLSGKMLEGPEVKNFENLFARHIGVRFAKGVDSARCGLYTALRAMKFNAGDEIIMAAYNFHVIPLLIHAFGLRPVFVDVDVATCNMDPSLIREKITDRTRGIVMTHLFGHPCEVDSILKVASEHNLKVIEDCAHANGAEYKGRKVGSFGDVGLFSFGPGKAMPCFGGGMLTYNSESLHSEITALTQEYPYPEKIEIFKKILLTLALYLATHPKYFPFFLYPLIRLLDEMNLGAFLEITLEGAEFSREAFKKIAKRMSNLQATVGMLQLSNLKAINDKLKFNAELLTKSLRGTKNLQILPTVSGINPSWLYYRVRVQDGKSFRRKLLRKGIDTQGDDMSDCSRLPPFLPMLKDPSPYPITAGMGAMRNSEPGTRNPPPPYPATSGIGNRNIELPNNPYLNEKNIEYIAKSIIQVLGK